FPYPLCEEGRTAIVRCGRRVGFPVEKGSDRVRDDMTIVVALLLPLAVYAGVWFVLGRRGNLAAIAAGAVCIWMLAGVAATMIYRGNWPRSTQVAWTGMREAPGAAPGSLVIGGSRQND